MDVINDDFHVTFYDVVVVVDDDGVDGDVTFAAASPWFTSYRASYDRYLIIHSCNRGRAWFTVIVCLRVKAFLIHEFSSRKGRAIP